MLYPIMNVDEVADLLVRVREDVCPQCGKQGKDLPELLELLNCDCADDNGHRCIRLAKTMLERAESASMED